MKKPILNLLFFFPGCLFAQYYYYTPNLLVVPTLNKKGETELLLGRTQGQLYKAVEAQAVYSLYPHCLVTAEYFDSGNKEVRHSQEIGAAARFGGIGAGIYESLKKGTASLIAGFGIGEWFSNFSVNQRLDARMHSRRWYVQPGIAYKSKAFFSSLAIRFSWVNYPKATIGYAIDTETLTRLQYIGEQAPWFLPELGAQAGLTYKFASLSVGFSSVFSNVRPLSFNPFNTGIMLKARF